MKKKSITVTSAQQTKELGRRVADSLQNACVIALEGNLGAGKTVFAKGIAEGLGVQQVVQSPTFVLMKVYPIKHKTLKHLVHVDCYRLDTTAELLAIGLGDYVSDPESVVIIEWAEKARALVPHEVLTVRFKHLGGTKRKITIEDYRPFSDIDTQGINQNSPR